ncbi:energy-coupling factor transporter ATPase [Fastidiosipila sanguinis]|uniref:Energy-coupling factor transporter ATPase n=1 Tax=Fastidiosipila sanguinis TaxID=236753 RepID=A0A2S0KLT2_9FIRM|nr:energy-coupling factor transporter ATPase [Fastidiosipila sanguinis]AVM41974.1 energy-coupling factor transporter ATPase [Fastidiosipila sanguinis]
MIESNETFLNISNVSYIYDEGLEFAEQALDNVSLSIELGQKIAILGENGSGKSTLAHIINALNFPQEGDVLIFGKSTQDEDIFAKIHQLIGMVFQNPDNQIVGTTVEEDVAFGPENLAIPREEMLRLVPDAIKKVGLEGLELRIPAELSGGQKQKLAIAGILAMQPKCIILDEATSMLDPKSRREILSILYELNEKYNITIINVTHHMDEVVGVDQVFVMQSGRVVFAGKAEEFFTEDYLLNDVSMRKPEYVELSSRLFEALQENLETKFLISPETAANNVNELLKKSETKKLQDIFSALDKENNLFPDSKSYFNAIKDNRDLIIQAKNLNFQYDKDEEDSFDALIDINLDIYSGEFIAICGSTGSGKTTLVQHFNGLIKLQTGELRVFDKDLKKVEDIASIRKNVGMVMQYPEDQLFAESIFEDVAFGPKQLGFPEDEIAEAVNDALAMMGMQDIDPNKSPFALSGGQMRRVAIAGILAMKPKVLILDEPGAGLDPKGKKELYNILKNLQSQGVTIIMISHSMEDVSKLADRVIVMKEAKIQKFATVKDVFANMDFLEESELDKPELIAFAEEFKAYYPELNTIQFRVDDLMRELLKAEIGSRATN